MCVNQTNKVKKNKGKLDLDYCERSLCYFHRIGLLKQIRKTFAE